METENEVTTIPFLTDVLTVHPACDILNRQAGVASATQTGLIKMTYNPSYVPTHYHVVTRHDGYEPDYHNDKIKVLGIHTNHKDAINQIHKEMGPNFKPTKSFPESNVYYNKEALNEPNAFYYQIHKVPIK